VSATNSADPAPRRKIDRLYRVLLPVYWVTLATATHLPRVRLPGEIPSSDKLAHLVAFGLLAFLFWRFCEVVKPPLSARFVWLAAATLCVYAALDEYTQQFVGRGVELADWVADAAGSLIVLFVLEVRRRRVLRRASRHAAP